LSYPDIFGAGDRVRTCIFQLGRLNVFHKPHAFIL